MEPKLEEIYRASLKLLAPLTPEKIYAVIVEEAVKLVDGQYGSVFLKTKNGFNRVYTSYPSLYQVKARKQGFTYKAYKMNEPIVVSIKEMTKHHPEFEKTNASSDILVPLSYRKKGIGVLTLLSKKGKIFKKKDLQIVQLFGPLAMLAIQNAHLHDESKKSLEMRDLFISMASHELKTPLTSITAFSQLIERKITKSEPISNDWVYRLVNEVQRLTGLVNELLQIDQIKTGRLHYNWHKSSIKRLVDEAVINFNVTHPNHAIFFRNNIQSQADIVRVDKHKLLQVLTNLLNNAAKFSPKNSEISISLSKKDHSIYLVIKDQGVGIPQKDLPHIFDKYYKGQNGGHEGMGLGLYIAKEIITEHQGKISIFSERNQGTTVQIELPQ